MNKFLVTIGEKVILLIMLCISITLIGCERVYQHPSVPTTTTPEAKAVIGSSNDSGNLWRSSLHA